MASTDMNIYPISTYSARKRSGMPAVVRARHGPPRDPSPEGYGPQGEGSGPQGGVPKGLPCPAFVTASLSRHFLAASLSRHKAGIIHPRSLLRRNYAHVLRKTVD
jgi:hypothetical protein